MAHSLLDLPYEVLHRILTNIDPPDLARLNCCRALGSFIRSDRLLWKELYLKDFDDPLNKIHGNLDKEEPVWETELQKLVKVRKILESTDAALKGNHIETIANSIDSLLKSSARNPVSKASRNLAFLDEQFRNEQNSRFIIYGSSLYQWVELHATSCPSHCNQQQEPIEAASEGPNHLSHVLVGHHETTAATPGSQTGPDIPPPVATNNPDRLFLYRQQLCAKLHCLYGVPAKPFMRDTSNIFRYMQSYDSIPVHPYVRSRVYDLRQHTDGTIWGPFIDDGSLEVDWEKLESIMLILNHNMSLDLRGAGPFSDPGDYIPAWDQAFAGAHPYSYFSKSYHLPDEPRAPLESQDPYNVTGTWMRVVCFLDYTELYNFNFSEDQPASGQPRPPLDKEEATRFITMKIIVTKIKPPGEDDGQDLPVVHFKGISSALRPSWDPNANSKIRGTVRLTPKGEVRWTTMSIIHGEERWRSEGIQIGGIQSARGVLGYWFDKDYDEHGPAGPTAFWKCHDGIE